MFLKLFLGLLTLIIHIASNIFPSIINKRIKRKINGFLIKDIYSNKIKLHGNTELLNNYGNIILSNHYNISDTNIIYSLMKNETYAVAKSDIFEEVIKNKTISTILNKVIFRGFNLISYKRKDKVDGLKVKKKILKLINKNKNVLIFPEGTSTRNGVPKNFKNGIFKLASEYKIPILPITLKFEKDVGLNVKDKFRIKNLFNNKLDVYIHDEIISSDWEYLKKQTFNTIVNCSK
jgi:1-acyl-sn-glycerol-3-phosphate acyltransferase